MTFVEFPGKTWEEILPYASANARDLVSQLVRYQSTDRMKAVDVSDFKQRHVWNVEMLNEKMVQVLEHDFFQKDTKAEKGA